jgi:hypothetical protein
MPSSTHLGLEGFLSFASHSNIGLEINGHPLEESGRLFSVDFYEQTIWFAVAKSVPD